MDFPLKNMFDAFKDEIWEELGPLDPNWFETLTSKQFISEENVSDQDDLCPNQEGHFKTPFEKDAVDSQLVSTPKVLRHHRTVSPGTEDEQSFSAPPWAGAQSPYWSQESKEGFQGLKLCDLQYQSQDSFNLHNTPHKSDVRYAEHISKALGADTHTDVSWTSSLNTPTASTLILTKHDKSPCPVSVSEEQNVVIVRKLFPSLASEDVASGVGFLSPDKNCTTLHQDTVACKSQGALEPPDCSQVSPNQNQFVWRHKLPDAIEDGDNTIASAIDGAEDILSIFFTNSNSALRKAKTNRVKTKQKVVARGEDPKVTVTSPTNTNLSADQGPACQERLCSSPPLNVEDVGDLQWSPLSLSDIPLSAADAICHDSSASPVVNSSKTPRKLERSLLKIPLHASGSGKRKFVYSVETPKVKCQGEATLKVESSSRIPESGQSIKSERVPDRADPSTSRNDTAPLESQTEKAQHLPEQGKVQDFNILQLSGDLAQDCSHIPSTGKVEAVAQDTSWNGFSPSACLSAMKKAYHKARLANPTPHCNRSLPTANLMTPVNESTITDSGLQSTVTDLSHVDVSCTNLESIGQSLQPLNLKIDDSGITVSLPRNKGAEQDGLLEEVTAKARLPEEVKETEAKANEECELLGESESARLLGSRKEKADNGTDGLDRGRLPGKPAFSAVTSGFKTASHKEIPISSTSMAKARHLFEETERENGFVPVTIKCNKDKLVTGDYLKTATARSDRLPPSTENTGNGFQLTASQKADVTALCTVLEEADSQFEFTQFRVAKSKQAVDATSTTEPENELDSDFLSGIDFDDSLSLDLGKNQTKPQRNSDTIVKPNVLHCDKVTLTVTESLTKTCNLSNKTAQSMTENVAQQASVNRHSVASDESNNKSWQTTAITMGNNYALTLDVGFKTAGGNVVKISKERLSKAKALFANLEGGIVSTPKNCDKTEISISSGATMCKSGQQEPETYGGFLAASGKAVTVSHQALKQAKALFGDISFTTEVQPPSLPTSCSKQQDVAETVEKRPCGFIAGAKPLKAQNPSNDSPIGAGNVLSAVSRLNAPSLKENRFALEDGPLRGTLPESIGHQPVNKLSDRELNTPSEKKTSLSDEAVKEEKGSLFLDGTNKELKERDLFPPQKVGFQTDRGKRVITSPTALKKAKILPSECEGAKETAALKNSPFNKQIAGPSVKGRRLNEANERRLAYPEACRDADAHLASTSSKSELMVLSTSWTNDDKESGADRGKLRCGFTTAGGAKVHVSQRNLLKAKKLLNDCHLGPKCNDVAGSSLEQHKSNPGKCTTAAPLKEIQPSMEQHTGPSVCEPTGRLSEASGTKIVVSSEAVTKAKAVPSSDAPFKGRREEAKETETFPPQCNGFQTASGKGVSISTAALKKAKALFSECEGAQEEGGGQASQSKKQVPIPNSSTSNHNKDFVPGGLICGFATARGDKVHVSQKNLLKAKKLLSECNLGVIDSGSSSKERDVLAGPSFQQQQIESQGDVHLKTNGDVFKNTQSGFSQTPVGMEEQSENVDFPPISASGFGGEFNMASGERVPVSTEAVTEAKKLPNLEATNGFVPQTSVFQTASGKGVAISPAALQKAKLLLRDCGGIEEEVGDEDAPFQKPHSRLGVKNGRHPATAAKLVAFSEGLGVTMESKETSRDSDKIRCSFMTAGGAKVLVSQKILLKAQNLLNECKPGVTDADSSSAEPDVLAELTFQQRQFIKEQSENDDFPLIGASGFGGGFNTTSGKRVSVSRESMTEAKNLVNSEGTNGFSPQTSGFQTASGKGVAISSTALQKAKLLLSDCEGMKKDVDVKDSPLKKPNPVQTRKNGGHPAAADQLASCPQGLAITTDNGDAFSGSDKMHCGFMTAGGAKVLVSQKNLMMAKNLLENLTGEDFHDEALTSKRLCTTEVSAMKPAESRSIWAKGSSKASVQAGESPRALTDAGTIQTPSEHTGQKKKSNIRQDSPPEVSQMSNSLEEEMLSVLEYEMNQLGGGGEAAAEVDKPVEPAAMHLQSLDFRGCTETQQQFLAQEAMDCTKALLEDEHLVGQRTTVTFESSTYFQDHLKSGWKTVEERKGTGKRTAEDPGESSQPPLKRRLLEEFDRTVVGQRSSMLEPEISSPNGSMKDRRAFRYSLSLQPNITRPHRNRTKCFESSFPQTAPSRGSGSADGKTAPLKAPVLVPPLCKSTSKETCHSGAVKDGKKASAVFIPPFKKQRVFVQDSCQEAKRQKNEEENKCDSVSVPPVEIESLVPPTENSASTNDAPRCRSKDDIRFAASANTSRNYLEINQRLPVGLHSEESAGETFSPLPAGLLLPNIELARDMQDMRIRKKKRQTIRPLPGKLFLTKASTAPRIPLKAAGAGKPPARYTRQQLYSHGVHPHAHEITGENAEAFRFSLKQFVTPETLMAAGGIQLADGGWLIPSEDGTAGREEFYRSLCDTPGVDPKLINEAWVHNHYRWVVWKQASMERSFPQTMGGRCLTPHQVLLQLKYRYDVEVDHSRRPALRKIMERDDTTAKTLVLCVCGVSSRVSTPKAKTPGGNATVDSPFKVAWLTDGWYAIKAQLDEPLTAMLLKGRLAVGVKLITHGAQLVGSQDACSPLEAPESLMLKIFANSSRPARWDSKLGFHRDPRPFLLPISSLYSSGGPVGCVDVVILRSYPLQWMERKREGGVVFRSTRAEEREERRYNTGKQKAMEALFAKIQNEFEKEDKEKNKPKRRRRTASRQDLASLQDGEELYEALGDDPAYQEAHLSVQQMEALHAHRRALVEKKQAEVQERYRRALEDAQDGEGGCPRRDVAPVWRLCVADSTQQPGSVYQMSLWRPPADLQSLLKEGCRYKVYNLTTSDAKKPGGSTTVHLTGTKKTQFEQLPVPQDWLSSQYQPRVCTDFVTLQEPDFQPLCGEVDLAGCVISVIDAQGPSPAFYLADGKLNLVKVRCFSSFAQSGLEDVVRPRALLALGNLQLRGQSIVPTPVVYAGDLTVFSTNPKEAHLQESLSQLRNLIQSQTDFVATAEEKLSCLKSGGLSYITSPAQQAGTPPSSKDRRPDTKVAFPHSARNLGPCTPIDKKPLETNSSTEKNPSSLKRRRALDYLSRIPAPPQLSPLNSTVSPCVKKTFVPPRRSGAACTLKPVQTLTPKPVSSPVEEEWVNDEELAMIDTQALHVGSSVCPQ